MMVALGDIAEINPAAPRGLPGSETVGFVPMASVSETGSMHVLEHRLVSELNGGYSNFRSGDILVAKITPCFENNKITLADIDTDHGFGSTEFHVIRPHTSVIDSRYLINFLRQDAVREAGTRRMTGSAGQKRVPRLFFANLMVPLPPISEQRRIAAILDQADDLRRKRRLALDRIDELPQAMFHAMFARFLSESDTCVRKPLVALTTKIGSGATPTGGESAYKSTGIALIRSMNVRDGHFLPEGLAFLSDEQAAKLDIVTVRNDDVLVNITGASVARVCRVPASVLPARVNQHVSIVRPTDELSAAFLEAFLLYPQIKTRLLMIAQSGATRQAITKSALSAFEIPVPPSSLQDEFALRISVVAATTTVQLSAMMKLDRLFAALQHRAFEGTLTTKSAEAAFAAV
jgi:type I restriction enzyme S subunit